MTTLMFLAAAARKAAQPAPTSTFQPMTHFPGQSDLLGWCRDMGVGTCILIVLVGVVYLLYGWSMFKPLLTLNAALVGGYLGVILGDRAGGYLLIGGLVGAGVAAAVAWPMMKWTVAVMGGVCGAFVGAGIWLTAGQDPRFAWAGAMTGLVFFGMLSFILYRGSIIVYTSFQGGLMVTIGLLGLLFKHPEIVATIQRHMTGQPMVLPITVLAATVMGLIFQQTHSSGGGEGAPAGDRKK